MLRNCEGTLEEAMATEEVAMPLNPDEPHFETVVTQVSMVEETTPDENTQ